MAELDDVTNKRTIDGALREAMTRLEAAELTPDVQAILDEGNAYLAEMDSWDQDPPEPGRRFGLVAEVMQLIARSMALATTPRTPSGGPPTERAKRAHPATDRLPPLDPVEGDLPPLRGPAVLKGTSPRKGRRSSERPASSGSSRERGRRRQPSSSSHPPPSSDSRDAPPSTPPPSFPAAVARVALAPKAPKTPSGSTSSGRPRLARHASKRWEPVPGQRGVSMKSIDAPPRRLLMLKLEHGSTLPRAAPFDAPQVVIVTGYVKVGDAIAFAGDVLINPQPGTVASPGECTLMLIGGTGPLG